LKTTTPKAHPIPEPALHAPRDALQGVDGCRGGWLVITAPAALPCAAAELRWQLLESLQPALATPGLVLTAVDMPVGLAGAGPRRCDQEARRLLGPRRSSVFPAPLRPCLAASTYAEACALSAAASGRRLSQQAYHLLPRIRQLDGLLQADRNLRQRVWEVHPELAFRQWNGGVPMAAAKKTAAGARERGRLVEAWLPGASGAIRASLRRSLVADDDILDALACLWSAARLRSGEALTLGGDPDPTGLPMRISA
jgi:predicted RNase H-like nuclease